MFKGIFCVHGIHFAIVLLTSSKQKLGQTWGQEILVLHKEIFGNFILIIAWFIYSHFFKIDKIDSIDPRSTFGL